MKCSAPFWLQGAALFAKTSYHAPWAKQGKVWACPPPLTSVDLCFLSAALCCAVAFAVLARGGSLPPPSHRATGHTLEPGAPLCSQTASPA